MVSLPLHRTLSKNIGPVPPPKFVRAAETRKCTLLVYAKDYYNYKPVNLHLVGNPSCVHIT